MGEPARKLPEIEPDIRPQFYDVNSEQGDAERRRATFHDINAKESNPETVGKDESLYDKESNGSNVVQGPWANNVSGNTAQPMGIKGLFKKKGAAISIVISLVAGMLGIGGFMGVSLLPVHFGEVLVEKFNLQLASHDIRTTKLLTKKMGSTKGICGSIVTIKCKYSTMSEKQIKNFEDAGIKVKYDPKELPTAFGRTRPTEFEFEGTTIKATEFDSVITKSPEFRIAVKKAYNPKFAGFTDNIWKKTKDLFKLSKGPVAIEGDGFDDQMEKLADDFQDANQLETQPKLTKSDVDPSTGDAFTDEALEQANEQIDVLNELIEDAGGDGSTASKLMNGAEGVVNAVKVTSLVDDACTVYRTFRSLGYAAKTVRVAQLAAFSMILLRSKDQIKAGEASDVDTEFIGKILTSTSNDELGNAKSATDSFGYRYAAYGDTGDMPMSAMQYMAAAGVSGMMINFFESHPAPVKGTCKFFGNPLVGFASLGLGVASGAGAVGGISKLFSKQALKAAAVSAVKSPGFWAGAGLALAEFFLPGLLKDIIAGKVIDKNTVGANAGDAITSGASGIMGTTAKFGGNAPLTPTQAVAYSNLSSNIAAKYSEEERLANNQFDATNSNTFLGKIVATLLPYASKLSSLHGILSSVSSLTTNSLASLTSTTKAVSTDVYTMCQDIDYKDMGIATDPFCNVVYGIPPESLDADPIKIANTLVQQNDIYESDDADHKAGDIVPDSNYDKFLKNCINRIDPLGYDSNGTNGSECLFNAKPENKNYYLYYIDKRVQDGMDEEEPIASATTPSNSASVVPEDVLKYCTENYLKNDSQSGMKRVFGASESAVSKNLESVSFPFKGGDKKIQFHKKAAPCLKAVVSDLSTVKHRPKTFDGSYKWRPNVNNTSVLSYHSFGIALDLDADENPNGGGSPGHCTTNMPDDFVAVFKKYGFRWGGNYKRTCDAMHFEWMGGN